MLSNRIIIINIDKTALYLSVEKENIEIVKLLLMNAKIDINILNIINRIFMWFKILYFNHIQNYTV